MQAQSTLNREHGGQSRQVEGMMNQLEYKAVQSLYKHRGDKSEATLARERQEARQMARQLWASGHKVRDLAGLKGRHVTLLREIWQGQRADPLTRKAKALSPGVQAIRLSTLRRLAEYGGKRSLIPKRNKAAGLVPRERTPAADIAWRLTPEQLEAVSDKNVRLVLRLASEFGLRRKEAWLVNVDAADKGTHLALTRTKGSVPRTIPIRTEAQRRLLEEVRAAQRHTPKGTLVPGATLKEALNSQKRCQAEAGITHFHGLRHSYAQQRYEELTGWPCAKAKTEGTWPPGVKFNYADAGVDRRARDVIAAELGHGRREIVSTYVGGRP